MTDVVSASDHPIRTTHASGRFGLVALSDAMDKGRAIVSATGVCNGGHTEAAGGFVLPPIARAGNSPAAGPELHPLPGG